MIRTSHTAPATRRPPDWRRSAACLTEDSELFFPVGTEGPWAVQIEQAKAVCRRCPSVDACLTFALNEGVASGIFGGLTEHERNSLQRSAARNHLTAANMADAADEVRQPARERTLATILEDGAVHLHNGHLGWNGAPKTGFGGRFYTAKQIAFIVDRGRPPEGPVRAGCTVGECILPAHLTDLAERGWCGSRAGYQRHRAAGEEACAPCRKANANADNRLRRTGTTKVLASR